MKDKNRFFFREDLTIEDKISRIGSDNWKIGNPIITDLVEEGAIGVEAIKESGKQELVTTLNGQMDDQEFRDFINRMYNRFGKRGNKFNQKLFRLETRPDPASMYSTLEDYEESQLGDAFGDVLSRQLYLKTVDNSGRYLDIAFRTSVSLEEYESSEDVPIQILTESGQVVRELEQNESVRVPKRTRVEARVFADEKYVSISNSEVKQKTHTDIVALLSTIANEEQGDDYE